MNIQTCLFSIFSSYIVEKIIVCDDKDSVKMKQKSRKVVIVKHDVGTLYNRWQEKL